MITNMATMCIAASCRFGCPSCPSSNPSTYIRHNDSFHPSFPYGASSAFSLSTTTMSPMDTSPASSTSSSSSSSSSVHHASLVDPSLHSPALLELLDIKLAAPVIEYVVDCVAETVDYAMGRPSSSRGTPSRRNTAFTTFVTNVITRAELTTPVILASLVYIDRAKPHLHIALEEWAHERVLLGAVICASKVCASVILFGFSLRC
jgi:hypothetical protein